MRHLIVTFLLACIPLLITCHAPKPSPRKTGFPAMMAEGWSCTGDNLTRLAPNEQCRGGEPEHLFLRVTFAASQKAVDSEDVIVKRASCTQAAYLTAQSPADRGKIVAGGKLYEDGNDDAIAQRAQLIIKDVQVVYCCSTDYDAEACVEETAEDWSVCKCLIRFRVPKAALLRVLSM